MKAPRHEKCPDSLQAAPGNRIENSCIFSFSNYILIGILDRVKYYLVKGRVASSQFEVGSQRPLFAARGAI